VSASKTKEDSSPVEKYELESSHRTFSEFLDCVRDFSVDERRAALKGPNAWMAEPLGPTRELDTADGKELLKYVWDHLPEFRTKEREAIQAYFVEHLNGENNRGIIIANAVRSCMLEHSEELESDDGRIGDLKQKTQDFQAEIPGTANESEELEGESTDDKCEAPESEPQAAVESNTGKPDNWEDESAYPSGHTQTDSASILGISRKTVRSWSDNGTIKPLPSGRISMKSSSELWGKKNNHNIQALIARSNLRKIPVKHTTQSYPILPNPTHFYPSN